MRTPLAQQWSTGLAPAADLLAHLDHCEECQVVAAALARHDASAEGAPAAAPVALDAPCTLACGSLIADRYEVRQLLGWGGMGVVYAAFDRQLNELVALKTLSTSRVDERELNLRLRSEAQLARRVTHPNVVRIFDFGTCLMAGTNGAAPLASSFITMELLNGQTLGERLRKKGRFELTDALAIATDVLAGLAAVHKAGIVHRDLKPDNVFLTVDEQDRPGRTVITDFGLAKPSGPVHKGISRAGTIVGTFAYLSPEQLDGKEATPASDIYALGIVLFEMLTGHVPGASADGTLLGESHQGVKEGIPRSVVAIIRKCLARDPSARFDGAGALSDALHAAFADRGGSTGRGRTDALPLAVRNKSRGIFAAGLATIIVVLSWGLWGSWKAKDRQPPLQQTTSNRDDRRIAEAPSAPAAVAANSSPTLTASYGASPPVAKPTEASVQRRARHQMKQAPRHHLRAPPPELPANVEHRATAAERADVHPLPAAVPHQKPHPDDVRDPFDR